MTPAGKLTTDEITLDYNSMTFDVKLSKGVTINNPICPPYLAYSVSGSGFSGTAPATVYSPDGNSMEVTLPSVSNWTQTSTTESKQNQSAYEQSTKTVSKYDSGICSGGGYVNYTRNLRTYTVDIVTTTTVDTYGVTGWKIGNKTYKPGEKVTISSGQTAVAEISKVGTTSTPVTEKYEITEYYDVDQDDDSQSAKGEVVTNIHTGGWAELSRVKQ